MVPLKYKRLLDFCKRFSSIICYGASEHGFVVKHFLEKHNINVSAFLISDDVCIDDCRDGIPVYSVKNYRCASKNDGIVLSLYERHHKNILRELKRIGCQDNVFAIEDSLQQCMHLDLVVNERDSTIFSPIDIKKDKVDKYKLENDLFWNKYKFIECRFFDVLAIGAYSLWIYYSYMRTQADSRIFHLYYPVVYEHRPEERLKGANGYLLNKMNNDGIAVITENNLQFWQYVIQKNKKRVRFFDDYIFTGCSKDACACCNNIKLDKELIYIEKDELLEGEKIKKKLGIRDKFICISNRDIVYRKKRNREKLKPDFRDEYRNSNIDGHSLATDYLARCDIQAVRMGVMVEKQWNHKNVINYAGSKKRSEFMDIYLIKQCKFFVSDVSGILAISMLMAKPMIVTNSASLTNRFDAMVFYSPDKDIALLKKLWDSQNKRYLTIRDMLNFEINICIQEPNLSGALYAEYKRRGIVPINNTPEEILAVVKEMNERIDGTIKYDEIDIKLQRRYRDIVDNYPMKENVLNNWRLGASFLRENRWLLN